MVYLWKKFINGFFFPLINPLGLLNKPLTIWLDSSPVLFLIVSCTAPPFKRWKFYTLVIQNCLHNDYTLIILYLHKLFPVPKIPFLILSIFAFQPIQLVRVEFGNPILCAPNCIWCLPLCVCVCVCIYIYVCVCVFVCVCIYIYIHTNIYKIIISSLSYFLMTKHLIHLCVSNKKCML